MARIPNINPGGQSIPSGYVVGRLSPGTGQQELIPLGDLGRQLVAQAIIMPAGSPTSITLTQPSAGLTITGGPSAFTFALANDLAALEGLGSTGIAVRTAANTWTQRTIAGTADKITVTDGDGVAGNPTLTVSATYAGQASITTLGTVGTGTWNATAIAGQYGGTGVANTGKTITLGGSLTLTGAFTTEFTVTANTSVTLPTTGTLATLAGTETLTNKTISGGTLSGDTTLPGSGQISSAGHLGLGASASATALLYAAQSGNVAGQFERTDASDAIAAGFNLRRTRSDATPPGSGFGLSFTFNLEGFTDNTVVTAGQIACTWEDTQTNDTTDRNSDLRFSTMRQNGVNVKARITSTGLFIFGTGAAATTAFPALKRASTVAEHRLGDDSAYAPASASEWRQYGGENGQFAALKSLTELTTIAAAATTDTTIQIPANAIVYAVSVRVTTAIPTATAFDIGVSGATTRYGTGISTAATTTSPGTLDAMRYYAAATAIRITPDASPAANTGRVRVTIHYLEVTSPTS